MQIIRKYGGAGADASWVNELSTIEKKAKPNYLESPHESESVVSSIQEEAYQKIKQKYQTAQEKTHQAQEHDRTEEVYRRRQNHYSQFENRVDGMAKEVVIEDQ